jgi:hypothetical protein
MAAKKIVKKDKIEKKFPDTKFPPKPAPKKAVPKKPVIAPKKVVAPPAVDKKADGKPLNKREQFLLNMAKARAKKKK